MANAGLRRGGADMTQGDIFRHLLVFAIPLLLGDVFQQMYNMVDTWVVGNFVNDEAFSAVGSVTPIVNLLIRTFMGFSTGASVVVAQYYGAKNREKVHDAVHTAVALTAVLSLAFTALGLTLVPFLLRLMKTPADVFPESQTYLTIFIAGLSGMLFYNMGSAILRAVGDSRRPFYYLVTAAVLNVVLDLVFVIGFGMGVEGVAWATVIAQGVSAILTAATLLRTSTWVRVVPRDIRFSGHIMQQVLRVGIPGALQMAITAFSNVFVQSYINQFGKFVMGGWTAYHKMEQLLFLFMQSLSHAATTFVGQNLGKGQEERAKEGVKIALRMSIAATAVCGVVVMAFAPQFVSFFNSTPEVIHYGTLLLRVQTPFMVACCANQIYAAALRGAGNSKIPMYVMLCSFVFFRQIYLFVMSNFIANKLLPLAMGYPAGWVLCTILITYYYKHTPLLKTRLVAEENKG
ncbi:MAG: MATE family efflux transporter [Oscillospiraceae bacterium]|nr:MATE family efflux transporter [Oscillospiraceae bacterium]